MYRNDAVHIYITYDDMTKIIGLIIREDKK